MSIAGLSLMILSCYLINSGTPFPGYAALGPTIAAALLILGGIDTKQPLPNRGLAIAPLPVPRTNLLLTVPVALAADCVAMT